MLIFQIIFIAISLAMDALSVSVAEGIKSKNAKTLHALRISVFFALFQSGMPLIGWFVGDLTRGILSVVDHWVAFILLSVIGVKMIYDALNAEIHHKSDLLDNKTLVLLSIATSIDALIVGVTLSLLKIPLMLSIGVIGVVTFVFCFFGFLFGKNLGKIFGEKIEIVGGIALILIGVKILLEHLMI